MIVSSTLELPISSSKKTAEGYDDSLEDLFNNALTMPLKVANTRHYYCDIFSRQSIGSEDGNSSSPDIDDDCINFLASVPNGCEIIQLIPKKPSAVIPDAMYQPECTNIQKILKSSCSAFRDISEIKIVNKKSQTDNDKIDDNENDQNRMEKEEINVDDGSSSSHV